MSEASTSAQAQPILREDAGTAAISEEEKLKPLAATPTTLDESDSDVIIAANDLAPQLVQWLTPSDQIRKWVVLVNQIAEGKIPNDNRPLAYPPASFEVEHRSGKLFLSINNYEHADWLIGVLVGISPVRLTHYYHVWRPALENGVGNTWQFRYAITQGDAKRGCSSSAR